MTRATYKQYPPTYGRGPVGPPLAANGTVLRWTPGPDELRLPSCEDELVPQNTRHAVAIEDGFGGLRVRWRGRPDVFVGADQFVYWDPDYDQRTKSGNPPLSPDVYVAFGVANRHRSAYVVWDEGKPPDFVLEVASPSSRQRDENEKRDAYAKMGVPEYFLYDPHGELKPPLSGFQLRDGEYRQLPEETFAEGVVGVRSKALGLCLCLREPGPDPLDIGLGWYDPKTGKFLRTRYEAEEEAEESKAEAEEFKAKAEASEARAKASDARAEAAEAEVAELKALIEKMRRG